MIKKYLILTLLMLSTINTPCMGGEPSDTKKSVEQVYQELGSYFQGLVEQDCDMVEIIKANFGVTDPASIDFLMQQIDPVNLAVNVFKQYFTLEEIQIILAFHTSEIGRKFANTFPSVMADYNQVLMQRIQDVQLAIVGTIANQSSK